MLKSAEHRCRYELVDWAGFEPATSRSFGGHTVIARTHACEASITTAELPALSLHFRN
jgi:hypothetical protein